MNSSGKLRARTRIPPRIGWTAKVTLKLGRKDAHYSGGLVAGAKILEIARDY